MDQLESGNRTVDQLVSGWETPRVSRLPGSSVVDDGFVCDLFGLHGESSGQYRLQFSADTGFLPTRGLSRLELHRGAQRRLYTPATAERWQCYTGIARYRGRDCVGAG